MILHSFFFGTLDARHDAECPRFEVGLTLVDFVLNASGVRF